MPACTTEPHLTFDKSVIRDVLNYLDKDLDDKDFIVEKSDKSQRVLTIDGEEISVKEFGGVQKGSQVFIKDDLVSLMRLTKKK